MERVRTVVGRYEVVRELGRGGMATVYLARQVDLDRLVALKELGALRQSDSSVVQRFLREARLAGSVSHPNVITVYDLFEHDGTPYIAMEYAERGTFRPYVGRISLSQLGGALEAALSGLAAAEAQGIVHRDLKPENLLVSGAGRVKISDFGIAKATNRVSTESVLTSHGATVGTPNYMAPEQALARQLGPWTDLYSLGIIAFECVIGVPPFGDTEEPMAVLMRQVNEAVPPVNELDPGIDSRLAGWIDRLVSKEPADRPQSATEAWDALEDILIALLGPRWRRDAALPLLSGVPSSPPGPATEPPPNAPIGPLTEAHLGALADLPTARAVDEPQSATVPPTAPPVTVAPPPQKRRRRRRGLPKLLFLGVAVLALGAAALSRTDGAMHPAPAARTSPQAPGATSPAVPGSTAGGVAQRLPTQGPQGTNLAAQSKSARRLARRYDSAAAQVARLQSAKVKGSPGARLVTALRRTAKAYRRAAAAASAGDTAGYAAALSRAEASKQSVDTALAAMGGTVTQSPASPQPVQPGSPTQPQPAAPCSGDSSSDDPSDDSCSP